MIYFFSGTPGSGKSLDLARCILNDLRFKRPVITNFEIYLPNKRRYKNSNLTILKNSELNPRFLIDFANNYFKNHRFSEGAISLYIDEAQLLFNARQWNVKGRDEWNAFFTNHRHLGYNIIMASQFDRMIDRQIRSLFEIEVVHRKLNNMGLKGLFFRVLFLSPTLFIKISFYYPLNEKLHSEFFRYNKSYAKIYNSYTSNFLEEESDQHTERKTGTRSEKGSRGSLFGTGAQSPFYKIGLLLLLYLTR